METPKTRAVMAGLTKKFNRAFDNPYYLRLANTHYTLLEVCEKLTEQGFECFTAKDEYDRETVHFIQAYKDGRRVMFGFSEVPFRWWVNNSDAWKGDIRCVWGTKDQFAYPYDLEYLMSHAVPCSQKELEEYERKKEGNFYVRLGNFPV